MERMRTRRTGSGSLLSSDATISITRGAVAAVPSFSPLPASSKKSRIASRNRGSRLRLYARHGTANSFAL
jgi:hypothetical protein